ncbi:dihydrodipicolinate synthetase family protein [Cucurbitaria berberidis CBS 394.84]|uniref:Dihydrodipicolinate synthetase family protein n=1 Tax=Cucurbitaria berberidis CBS 394.84 TaxID=1168544 RepID=A0A9P4GFU7_9PLEO|nr:dihydrodipicolinate synthetase family protein [Cucurbitaria berberidis CBS 394.84]KAF1845293.1 dihydrodipicolinate synthetase family protein [Cucurbitaria berberidis CBS 394.84]
MATTKPPFGVYTPLVTFFKEDESLDLDAIKAHIKRMAEGGVAGLVLQGSNGEAPHLDHGERINIIQTTRSYLNELGFTTVKLIVGCGAASVRETLVLISEASQAGADYALVLPPAYWTAAMTPAVVENFFSSVAAEAKIPLLIYNFPGVTSGIDISSDSIVRLAKSNPGKIVGCKLTCGNLGKLQRVWSCLPEDSFAAFAGKSDFMLPGLVAGSNGVIAALANVVPALHVRLLNLWQDGKLQEARQLQSKLSNADGALQKVGVAGVKAVISHFFGYGTGRGRRPLGTTTVQALNREILEPLEDVIQLEKKQRSRLSRI